MQLGWGWVPAWGRDRVPRVSDGRGRRGLGLKRNCMKRSGFGEVFAGSKNDEGAQGILRSPSSGKSRGLMGNVVAWDAAWVPVRGLWETVLVGMLAMEGVFKRRRSEIGRPWEARLSERLCAGVRCAV